MNIFSIIEEIEKIDPEFQDRISPRRAAIKNITSFGSKVAVAALPFALSTLFKKAYGQTTNNDVTGTLNFALKLEYLEAAFYNLAIATPGLIATADLPAFQTIAAHENSHVTFLKSVLGSAAVPQSGVNGQGVLVNNVPSGVYDFTGGGAIPPIFTGTISANYPTFLILANAFEDTGVRAYKGQAGFHVGNATLLNAALSIHSVEARHASHVRTIRRRLASQTGTLPKSWITGANDTGFAGANGNYLGEDNLIQANIDLTTLTNPATGAKFSASAVQEAFDEPLTYAQVLPLVTIFGVR